MFEIDADAPEQGVKLLGFLLTWSAGQPLANRWAGLTYIGVARDKGGLVRGSHV
jgi:hypothetical protein